MYPPREDFIVRRNDGSISALTRGHAIELDAKGGFVIRERRTGLAILERRGAAE
jgi:hypothetical protein